MMLAKGVPITDKNKYYGVLGYSTEEDTLDGEPDYVFVPVERDFVDDLVDEYLNGLGMVAISRTNCPICGEDIFNGWRCKCLSDEAQTKFQWRYR